MVALHCSETSANSY